MGTKILLLGLNRSGTKLASLMIARAFNFSGICLEPFYWEGGIDISQQNWEKDRKKRTKSKRGREEHVRLPVYCNEKVGSPWLNEVLCEQGWEVIKLVEIGRSKLYHAINPNALIIALIRHPVYLLGSLAGTDVQKKYVAEQWQRLRYEEGLKDPLPEAEEFLLDGLGDCARLYKVLYDRLNKDLPKQSIRISYESLLDGDEWLYSIATKIGRSIIQVPNHKEQVGTSSQVVLESKAISYIEENLSQTYEFFLDNDAER